MKTNPLWLNTNEYPFANHYLEIDGRLMHYIDEGQGEILLFVHGTPSWSYDFREIIKVLSNRYRCIALDHIGFGLSDKPVDYPYSTLRHRNNLAEFIHKLNLTDFTLIAHDFGGPISLDWATDHPDRIRRLILMNTWMWSSENDPEFKRFARILKSPILPPLYKYLNFSVRFLMPASFGKIKLTKIHHSQYLSPFKNIQSRESLLAFARSLLLDQNWFETIWNKRDKLSQKPLLLIWGMKDKFVNEKYLNKFKQNWISHQELLLPDCGHFPQEEYPKEVSESIINFLTK